MHFWTFSNLESRCLPVGVMPLHLHEVRMACVQVVNDDRIDELLLDEEPNLSKAEQAYLESLEDPNADLIVSLLWR